MKATFYVQFAGERRGGRLAGARAVRVTQTRPRDPLPGSVLARLTVDVPDEAFEPLEAEGVLLVEQVERIPVEPAPIEHDGGAA